MRRRQMVSLLVFVATCCSGVPGEEGPGRMPGTRKGWEGRKLQPPHSSELMEVKFLPGGKRVISASTDLFVHDVQSGKLLLRMPAQDDKASNKDRLVLSLDVRRDGKEAVTGHRDGTISTWDLVRGKEASRWQGHSRFTTGVRYGPDGKWIVSGGDDKLVRIWDAATERQIKVLKGHANPVSRVAVSPDGRLILSGGTMPERGLGPFDFGMILWDRKTGRRVGRWTFTDRSKIFLDVEFTPNGKLAIGCSGKKVRMWRTATGEVVGELDPHINILSMAASSDGKQLICAGTRGGYRPRPDRATVVAFDLATLKEAYAFGGDPVGHRTVAISPDSNWLATGGSDSDRTVRLWRLKTARASPVTSRPSPLDNRQ